eukprot:6050630-Pyramimonas_sp.AAC.1
MNAPLDLAVIDTFSHVTDMTNVARRWSVRNVAKYLPNTAGLSSPLRSVAGANIIPNLRKGVVPCRRPPFYQTGTYQSR